MTVSAIITTYNRASIVPRAIKSVLDQSRPVDELVVVDDGSSDNTRAVVSAYGPPVRYVHQKNGGLSAARNTGAREASGEWVAFLDDDDEWVIDKNERQIKAIESEPGAVLCYGGPLWMSRSGATRFIAPMPPDQLWPSLRLRSQITPCAAIVRRDVFLESGGFDEKLRCVEDWEFAVRFARGRKLTAVEDGPLVKVHEDPNSMSKQVDAMLAAEMSILESLLVDLAGVSRAIWRRRIQSLMFYRAAISERERGRSGLRHALNSLMCWPSPGFIPTRFLTAAAGIRDQLR